MILPRESESQKDRYRCGDTPSPAFFALPSSDDEKVAAAKVCPRCQRDLTAHYFTTRDGLSIVTYHCREHGDVIPLPGAHARDH
ncbi:MAG: hypothetical protein IPK63_05995 [Candidatus Competibacteraceae bacterium]|nr:hypothetical protein [Candidatus Competibacteraceae bacterium]